MASENRVFTNKVVRRPNDAILGLFTQIAINQLFTFSATSTLLYKRHNIVETALPFRREANGVSAKSQRSFGDKPTEFRR